MLNYTLRRAALAVLIIWFISIAVFVLMRLMPGEAALLQQGVAATPERVEQVRREMGLDKPLVVQYVDWLRQVGTLDLGRSFVSNVDVSQEFRQRFPITFQLMLFTLFWTVLFGIPFGIISAIKSNALPDYTVRLVAIVGLAVPSFWLATLVLIVPQQQFGYAPALDGARPFFEQPWQNLAQFVPPSLVLAFSPIASVMRLTRSSLLEVMRMDYIRTARAKGLSDRVVIYRHALKNSIIPVVTVIGLQVGTLLGGTIIVESIFNLGGLGQWIYRSVLQKDFPVAQSLVLYIAATVVFLNLLVDLAYAWLDPRIRYA